MIGLRELNVVFKYVYQQGFHGLQALPAQEGLLFSARDSPCCCRHDS